MPNHYSFTELCSPILNRFYGGFRRTDVPLLNLVETGENGDGDEDHDGLLAVASLDLRSILVS